MMMSRIIDKIIILVKIKIIMMLLIIIYMIFKKILNNYKKYASVVNVICFIV